MHLLHWVRKSVLLSDFYILVAPSKTSTDLLKILYFQGRIADIHTELLPCLGDLNNLDQLPVQG